MSDEKMVELVKELRDEADLCRNETATDIAALLDRAATALERQREGYVMVPVEVAAFFARERLSNEPYISDLVHRSQASQLRELAEQLERRDDKIRAIRTALDAAIQSGGKA